MRACAWFLFAAATAGCAADAVDPCEGIVCLDALPAEVAGEAGETIVRVALAEDGFLAAATDDVAAVERIALLPADTGGAAIDEHASAVGARLAPGDYDVVVAARGAFTLRLAATTPATLEQAGIAPELAADALAVVGNAWAWGATRRTEYAIVDFTLHSAQAREWVVDLSTGAVLWQLRVAHGRKSTDGVDLAHAVTFSNEPGSNQSSLGLYRSAGTYTGTFGPSFRLEGLEPGFNDNVCDRDIVMHPWAPVGDDYVARCGWARPSLGCPAIDSTLSMPVRDRLARPDGARLDEGVLMLFWYPGTDWHASSSYLRASQPTPALIDQMGVECDSSQDSTPAPPESSDYACD